jgi:tetratricopeptide (TPR) repeat protein
MRNTVFCVLFILFFQFSEANTKLLKIAQDYLDHSDYKKAMPLLMKISQEAKQKNDIFLFVTSQNGLADCYTDLGAYYKSLKLLEDNLATLNKYKSKDFQLYAEIYLLLAQNFDYLF